MLDYTNSEKTNTNEQYTAKELIFMFGAPRRLRPIKGCPHTGRHEFLYYLGRRIAEMCGPKHTTEISETTTTLYKLTGYRIEMAEVRRILAKAFNDHAREVAREWK